MARTRLDLQLQDIRTGIIQLGTQVETALSQVLQAIQHDNQALCDLVITADDSIDELRARVDRLAFLSLTLQQPLGGRDLRFLSSISAITTDLERIGDNAKGTAKLLLRMAPLRTATPSHPTPPEPPTTTKHMHSSGEPVTEASILAGLIRLGQEAQRVLRGTMRAFEHNDTSAARVLWQEDDVVDVCYHLVRHDLMHMLAGMHAITALQQDELIMQRMTYYLWIAHNLERVGDHCTNICERIVFFLEGEGTISSQEHI